jgi:hypothetical protein
MVPDTWAEPAIMEVLSGIVAARIEQARRDLARLTNRPDHTGGRPQ